MISIINFLLSLVWKPKIIQVRRLPIVKSLRAHSSGLTLGFFLILLHVFFNVNLSTLLLHVGILLWFMLVTYFGGLLFILSILVTIILYFFPSAITSLPLENASWFFTGYLTGAILAICYNDLVYLFIQIFEKDRIKIVFAYDTGKKVNAIKCPIEEDEHAFKEIFASKPKLKDQKLYKYKNLRIPNRPYTIVFAANPKILERLLIEDDIPKKERIKKLIEHRSQEGSYVTDPIINDREIFLRSVEKGLFSFDHNEIMGRPEIWGQIRVITVFDESLNNQSGVEYGLVGEFQEDIYTSESPEESIDNNLLDPLKEMDKNLANTLQRIYQTSGDEVEKKIIETILENPDDIEKKKLKNVDVIYGLSASPTHDRSTAHYTDWIEIEDENVDKKIISNRNGKPFTFDYDPYLNKRIKEVDHNGNITKGESTILIPEFNSQTQLERVHEYDAKYAGRIALNVITATSYTYIHEFSHAMSNVFHGAIVDEYVDYFAFESDNNGNQVENPQAWFYTNRVDRNRILMVNQEVIPVDKVFAQYNDVTYHSDLAHPSAEEGWSGYFPERHPDSVTCMMDGPSSRCQYDQLLRIFIYDRIIAKFARK